MAEGTVRLASGQPWTARHFLDHYFEPTASGTPVPVAGSPAPVDMDKSWYMDEGPGRYYHPGMFPIIRQILDARNLAAGTYDLKKLANEENDLKARISHYTTDMRSPDYPLRALVFGNESAKISGQVVVNSDGSKTFRQIQIQPLDTQFNFEHKTLNLPLEGAREVARRAYDPENQGVSYDVQYRGGPGQGYGTGRIYDPFTDSQLSAALRKEFVYPGRGPAGLLPSITGKAPLPYTEEQLQYLNQANGNNTRASASTGSPPAARIVSPANRNSSSVDVADWMASLAGVDPANPTEPAPQQADRLRGIWSNEPMERWTVQPPIHFPF